MSLERPSNLSLALLSAAIIALCVIVAIVPRLNYEGRDWKDPAKELPAEENIVIGWYPAAGAARTALVSRDLVFIPEEGTLGRWYDSNIDGGAVMNLGVPYRWDYPPEIPGRLLSELAKGKGPF